MNEVKTYIFENIYTGEVFATTNTNENDAYNRAYIYFGDSESYNDFRNIQLIEIESVSEIYKYYIG